MAEMIRFHLDENVHLAVSRGLRQRGIDVSTTQESNLLGTADEVQLAFAQSAGRVIVIVHTESDEEIRIISMRRATKHEERNYFQQVGN